MKKKGECEVCGKYSDLYLVEIDGNEFWVCEECSYLGKKIPNKNKVMEEFFIEDNDDIVEKLNYLMKKYGREEISKILGEQQSYLLRVINKKTLPNEKLIKKLKTLNLK